MATGVCSKKKQQQKKSLTEHSMKCCIVKMSIDFYRMGIEIIYQWIITWYARVDETAFHRPFALMDSAHVATQFYIFQLGKTTYLYYNSLSSAHKLKVNSFRAKIFNACLYGGIVKVGLAGLNPTHLFRKYCAPTRSKICPLASDILLYLLMSCSIHAYISQEPFYCLCCIHI